MSIFITDLFRNHPPEHRCFGGLGHVIGKAPMEHVGDKHQIKDMMIRYLSTLSSAMSSKKWVYFSFKFHALRWKPDAIRPVVLHAGECQPELVAGRSGPAFQVPPTSQCCPACTLRFQLFSQFRIREITKDFKFKNAAWSNTSYRSFLGAKRSSVIGGSSQHASSQCCLIALPMSSTEGRLFYLIKTIQDLCEFIWIPMQWLSMTPAACQVLIAVVETLITKMLS
jgi:hypothetical protein